MFASEHINGIHGWYFEPTAIEEANQNCRLLTMDFEFGGCCPLRCVYCYRSEDSRDEPDDLLTFGQWKRIVDEAADIGVKSFKMIGGGEITEEDNFVEAMEYIASKGIITVLFTSGTLLGDDARCRRKRGMTSRELAEWMCDVGMAVFLKVDSLKPDVQDKIVGKKGYTATRNKALDLLLSLDFNKHNPTRLGLEVNVSSYNIHEIMDIYSLRTKHNLYEDVVISMPCDMYFKNKDYDITLAQKEKLYQDIYTFNIENNIPFSDISPFIGGLVCTQLGNGLYVTNQGNVFHCPGGFKLLGNAREEPLSDIWQRFTEAKKYDPPYFCPFREETEIIPTEFVEQIRAEFMEELPKV